MGPGNFAERGRLVSRLRTAGNTLYVAAEDGGKGLRLFSICGDICQPGVFEVPVGTTLRELIRNGGGMRNGLPLLSLAPSGPSGGFLPAILRPEDLPLKKRKNFPADRTELDIRDVPLDKVEYDDLGLDARGWPLGRRQLA